MRWVKMIKRILVHICIICSIVLLTARVFDSYNPYMDFLGHSVWALYCLCFWSLILGVSEIFRKEER